MVSRPSNTIVLSSEPASNGYAYTKPSSVSARPCRGSSCADLYIATAQNTDYCPDNFEHIQKKAECKAAARALGYNWESETVHWSDAPSGCGYCPVGHKMMGRWNGFHHGYAHPDDGRICKLKSSPPTPAPDDASDDGFVEKLNLPKHCSGREQTDFLFGGTIEAHHVIRPSDPTAFQHDLRADGRGPPYCPWWDYRAGGGSGDWLDISRALLFKCTFKHNSGQVYELKIQANPHDFPTHASVRDLLEPYLQAMGRTPEILWSNINFLTVNGDGEGHSMGANAYYGEITMNFGENIDTLGEVFFHELTHLALEPVISWATYDNVIQKDCNEFFSSYSADYPQDEGVAESFLPYWALVYRKDRLTEKDVAKIIEVGPNRLKFFHEHVDSSGKRDLMQPPS